MSTFNNTRSTVINQAHQLNVGNEAAEAALRVAGAPSHAAAAELPDIMVVVAKDNEWTGISKTLEVWFAYSFEKREIPGAGHVIVCSSRAEGCEDFFAVFLGGQGKDDVERVVPVFLEALAPRYITTIGICGGFQRDAKRALFIGSASGLKHRQVDLEQLYNEQVLTGAVSGSAFVDEVAEVFHADAGKNLADALYRNAPTDLFSRRSGDSKGKPFHVISIPDPQPPEEQHASFQNKLQLFQAQAQDMEIAWLWKCIDHHRKGAPSDKYVKLPAIKVVSDYGEKSHRKENMAACARNAASALQHLLKTVMDPRYPVIRNN